MRRSHIFRLLIISLILTLSSCGGYDLIYDLLALRKAVRENNRPARQANQPRSDGLVTVKPPYTGLKYDNSDPHPRI